MREPETPAQTEGRRKFRILLERAIESWGSDRGAQQRFADRCRIPSPTIGQYRMGRRLPTQPNVEKLAEQLGLTPTQLHEMLHPPDTNVMPVPREPDDLDEIERSLWTAIHHVQSLRARSKPAPAAGVPSPRKRATRATR